MDIQQLAITLEPVRMELLHPISGEPLLNDAGKPMALFLRNNSHPEVKAVEQQIQQRSLDVIRKGRVLDVEEDERNEIKKTLAYLANWENIQFNKKDVKFSPAEANKIIGQPQYIWIRRQIMSFVRDMGNFILA